jgi:hypothetical protein
MIMQSLVTREQPNAPLIGQKSHSTEVTIPSLINSPSSFQAEQLPQKSTLFTLTRQCHPPANSSLEETCGQHLTKELILQNYDFSVDASGCIELSLKKTSLLTTQSYIYI